MEGITEKSWDKRFYIEVSVFIVIIISIIATGAWIVISNDLLNLNFRDSGNERIEIRENETRIQGDFSNITSYNDGKIEITPASLRECFDDSSASSLYQTKGYLETKGWADLLGVSLEDNLKKEYVISSDGQYYLCEYCEYKKSPDCDRSYLIQRIKLTEVNLDINRTQVRSNITQYLVEAWQLSDANKRTILADSHRRRYVRNIETYEKQYIEEVELGCGIIPGVIVNSTWPYTNPYKLIQDYSNSTGLYDDVVFDFSTSYKAEGSYDKSGAYSMEIDAFEILVLN